VARALSAVSSRRHKGLVTSPHSPQYVGCPRRSTRLLIEWSLQQKKRDGVISDGGWSERGNSRAWMVRSAGERRNTANGSWRLDD